MLFREWCAEWRPVGEDTAPANRSRAEAAIARLYREIGERPPRFTWCLSPIAGAWAVGWKSPCLPGLDLPPPRRREFGEPLADRLLTQLRPSIPGVSLRQRIGAERFDRLQSRLEIERGLLVGAEIDRAVINQLLVQRNTAPGPTVQATGHAIVTEIGIGHIGQDVDWICFHQLWHKVIGSSFPPQVSAWIDMWAEAVKSCGWWWPCRDVCVVCERPSVIRTDGGGRLHHRRGPALCFPDGNHFYLWRGTSVPESWIAVPDDIDAMVALTWPNVEQRRAAAEIFGWRRILKAMNPRTVDRDADPEIGELLEVHLPRAGRTRFLKVVCGTGREFVLAVPRQMRTAREANAWTYELTADEYQLEART